MLLRRLRSTVSASAMRSAGLLCAAAVAIVSTFQGVHNALRSIGSQDMQWSAVHLLLQRIDPWAAYLAGNRQIFALEQYPNYLPSLYLLTFPIGWLTLDHAKLVWLLSNLIFAVSSCALVTKCYGMGRELAFVMLCLFLAATPTRNTLGNGQTSLLILLLWSLSLLAPRLTDARSAIAGVSYLKFNFAPPTFLYLLFRGGVRAVLFSAIPSALATLMTWLWLTGGHQPRLIGRILVEPLLVATRGGYFPIGHNPNVMDIVEDVLRTFHVPMNIVNVATISTAVVLCAALLFLAMFRSSNRTIEWHMALLAIMSIGLFRHHDYDSVVLLIPACYAVRFARERLAQIVLALIAYVWYVQRLVEVFTRLYYSFVITWIVLMLILYFTYRLGTQIELADVPGQPFAQAAGTRHRRPSQTGADSPG